MKKYSIGLSSIFIFFLISFSSYAQTVTWDGGGDGFSWKDEDNWDTNLLPCTGCDVAIANAQVVLEAYIEVKSLNLSGVNSTSLLIEKGAELNLLGALSDGLTVEDNASCLVLGTLNIENSASLGVELDYGTIEVQDGGVFEIDDTGGHCINIGLTGIFSLINNSGSPSLNLESCGGSAINNSGSFTNNLGEVNTGNLNIVGISNQGAFENNGSIILNSQSQTGLLNAGASAVFFNNTTGIINITGGVDGIINSAVITNNGEIEIESPSEDCINSTAGLITSEGIFILNNAGDNGINLSGGELNVIGQLEINAPTVNGILSNSEVMNTGDILIKDASTYIRNINEFTNKGSIDLLKTPAGLYAGSGIVNQVGGTFLNQGDITIEDTGSGIGTSGLIFENTAASNITIRRVGTGIVAGASFINNGSLTIDRAQFYHISISPSVIFENEADGIINLDSLVGASALGVIQCQSSGTFLNRGLLDIDDKSNSSLYFLGATFHNYGTLNYNGEDFNTVGNFRNFSSGTVDGTDLTIIGGTLNNSGHLKGLSSITADDLINSGLIHLTYGRISGTPIHNMVSGTIRIDDTQPYITTSRGAIRTEDKLLNEGLIQINSSPHNGIQVYDNDSLINSGSIEINNVLSIGIDKIGANGEVRNMSTGTIQINSSDSYGIQLETDFENEGNLSVINSLIGVRLPSFASGDFINSGQVEFNACTQQAFFGFDTLSNAATGTILVENCNNVSQVEVLNNVGELEFVNTSHGLIANQILNSGTINALNVPNIILRNISAASGHTFSNTGVMDFENVTQGIHFVYASTNHGEIRIDGATVGIASRMDNFGKIEAANCQTALTGGIDNKQGGEVFLDNNTNVIVRTNEACGFIKSTTGYEITTENYGFISHPDPINANVRVSNYGVFENPKGMRQGQAGSGFGQFNNDGLVTGKVNGKPSVLVKELNAMKAHSSFTVSNSNLYTDASLSTLGGGFASADNSISLNAIGALADTLYTSVNYGSGCNTVIRIPVKQDANCGGVYTTAVPSDVVISTNFQWHDPLSWEDKIVPDGCTNVVMDAPLWIPANSKARAHSIDVNVNFRTETGAVLIIDPSN